MLFGQEPKQPIGEIQKAEQQSISPFYQQSQEIGKMMLESQGTNYRAYLRLLGYVEVNKQLMKVGDPLLNQKGAGSLLLFLDSLNTHGTFLTNLSDHDVIRVYHDVYRTVNLLLLENQIEWELPMDVSKWSQIREILMHPIYFALRRGDGALEKEFFSKIHESKNIMHQGSQQQFKKGFLTI